VRGRKPVPVEVRQLTGNPRKHAIPEPITFGGRPLPGELTEPPDGLPELAKEYWRKLVPRLAQVGILDRVDIPALEAMAVAYDRMVKSRRVIDREGFFARGSQGQLVAHPALKIERDSAQLLLKFNEQFGTTPVARVRLGLAELERQSLAHELMGHVDADGGLEPAIDGTAE
jgi:P27 family predicted phage terminase small subunit